MAFENLASDPKIIRLIEIGNIQEMFSYILGQEFCALNKNELKEFTNYVENRKKHIHIIED